MASMNKRKRESQDIAGGRPAPGMNQMGHEFEQHYLQTDDGMGNPDAGMDFGVTLGDNTNPQASGQMQVQGGDGHSASDTAAAAMAQYHTMTVPQSTEQSFLAQTNDSELKDPGSANAQHRTSSFGDFDAGAVQSSPNGDASPGGGPSSLGRYGPKPAVGSEEWHKVRKDNHKEGRNILSTFCY